MEKGPQEFTALDENGKEYRLRVLQEDVSVSTRANPSAVAPGLELIVTEDGERVNRLDKGKYQIAKTLVILSSCDPDAP